MSRVRGEIRNVLRPGRFARSAALLLGGSALGQAIVVAASPALTRLYGPDDFGVLAVFTSIVYVLSWLTSLRYDAAVTIPEDDATAADLVGLSLLLVAALSLLTGVIVWLLRAQIAAWGNVPEMRSYLWLIPVTMFGAGIYKVLNSWAIRMSAFGRLARVNVGQGVVVAALQLGMGLLGIRPLGLLLGFAAGQASGSVAIARPVWMQMQQVTLTRIRRVAAQYRSFAFFGAPAILFNTLGYNLPLFMLAALYDAQVAGWYALAQRVIGRPLQLIATAVSQVYWARASRLAAGEPGDVAKVFARVTLVMTLLALPYVAVLVVLAPWLFPIVFGQKWYEAGVYTQVLSVMFLLDVVVAPTATTLDVLQRQDLSIIRETIRLALVGAAFGLSAFLDVTPTVSVILLGVAGSLAGVATLLTSLIAIRAAVRAAAATATVGAG